MTDLPRFHKGAVGELSFDVVNEMMSRLDTLLPIVQAIAAGGGTPMNKLPTVFPVYAERSEYKTTRGQYKYRWFEVTITENTCVWDGETIGNPGDTQLRAGGASELETGGFGIIPIHPRDENPDHDVFVNGFALAVAIVQGNEQANVGGVRYLLFPLPTPQKDLFCMITGEPTLGSITVGDNVRDVNEYPAELYRSNGEGDLLLVNDEVTLVDLNAPGSHNEPTITGAETKLELRPYNEDTIFNARKIGEDRYAFCHLPRYDVTCT